MGWSKVMICSYSYIVVWGSGVDAEEGGWGEGADVVVVDGAVVVGVAGLVGVGAVAGDVVDVDGVSSVVRTAGCPPFFMSSSWRQAVPM
jgi:hypothetical protein